MNVRDDAYRLIFKKVYFSEWSDSGKKTIHKSPKRIFMYV